MSIYALPFQQYLFKSSTREYIEMIIITKCPKELLTALKFRNKFRDAMIEWNYYVSSNSVVVSYI